MDARSESSIAAAIPFDLLESELFGRILDIPEIRMEAFIAYSWPGNVREPQNLVERAVILLNNGVLPNPLPRCELSDHRPTTAFTRGTFTYSQRDLILQALAMCSWGMGGPRGAATQLGQNDHPSPENEEARDFAVGHARR